MRFNTTNIAPLSNSYTEVIGLPPPVTSNAPLSVYTDPSGDTWVAKGGVYGGAWKRARDVLHCQYTRTTAWNSSTSYTAFNYPNMINDPYGMYVSGTGVFTAPVTGVYSAAMSFGTVATASGQWVSANLNGAISLNYDWASSAGTLIVMTKSAALLTAGSTIIPQQASSVVLTGSTTAGQNHFEVNFLGTG